MILMRLFAGNLPWSVDDNGLRDLFSTFGEVTDCKVIMEIVRYLRKNH